MMEEWRAVPGYEGLYEVSNKGNVRNVRSNKLLRLQKTNNGYIRVVLSKNRIKTGFQVHRLVAQAFLLNPDNLPQVNHKNEVKSDNCVDNLEWCTVKYNNDYGTRKEKVRASQLKSGYWTGLSKEEYWKKYRDKNKEKIREKQRGYMRKYYENNKEKVREHMREYRKKRKNK